MKTSGDEKYSKWNTKRGWNSLGRSLRKASQSGNFFWLQFPQRTGPIIGELDRQKEMVAAWRRFLLISLVPSTGIWCVYSEEQVRLCQIVLAQDRHAFTEDNAEEEPLVDESEDRFQCWNLKNWRESQLLIIVGG